MCVRNQDHYDYGLRNLKAVLNMAGALKRADPTMNEEAILMRALRYVKGLKPNRLPVLGAVKTINLYLPALHVFDQD